MTLIFDRQVQVRERLADAGLTHLDGVCQRFAATAWWMLPTEPGATGASRLGGAPDLPAGAEWPVDAAGRRGNFFGQLDLATLPAEAGLASSGLLSLFTTYLDNAAEPVTVATVLTPAGTALAPVAASEDDDDYADPDTGYLSPVGVRLEPMVSLPFTQADFLDAFLGACRDDDELYELQEAFPDASEETIGQLGGFGNPHSGDDFRRVLAFHRHGHPDAQWCDRYETRAEYLASIVPGEPPQRYAADYEWIFDNAEALAAETAQTRLLLRIDSNHPMRLNLMDWDPIYFYGPTDELAAGRFERVEAMVTQG